MPYGYKVAFLLSLSAAAPTRPVSNIMPPTGTGAEVNGRVEIVAKPEVATVKSSAIIMSELQEPKGL